MSDTDLSGHSLSNGPRRKSRWYNSLKGRAYFKQYYQRNKEKFKQKEYRDRANERRRLRRQANPGKYALVARQYREQNRDRIKVAQRLNRARNWNAYKRRTREWKQRHPGYRYARDDPDIQQIIKAKPETCPICHEKRRLVLDHDHHTGKIRGWICQPCNVTIGFAKENSHRLRACAEYIEAHHPSTMLPAPRDDEDDAEIQP